MLVKLPFLRELQLPMWFNALRLPGPLKHSLKSRVYWRIATIVLMAFAVSACQSLNEETNWPEDVPDKERFLQAYHADTENQQEQTRQQYLNWIIRFYQGGDLMSTGWNDLTPAVLMGMSGETLQAAQTASHQLGVAISSEWAKDNRVRKIDTSMLSLWGTVMLSIEEPPERLLALRRIGEDVDAIMRGELAAEQISDERYMQLLDLPEFF